MLQAVRKIWRATSVQSFEGQGGRLKPHTTFNRKCLAAHIGNFISTVVIGMYKMGRIQSPLLWPPKARPLYFITVIFISSA